MFTHSWHLREFNTEWVCRSACTRPKLFCVQLWTCRCTGWGIRRQLKSHFDDIGWSSRLISIPKTYVFYVLFLFDHKNYLIFQFFFQKVMVFKMISYEFIMIGKQHLKIQIVDIHTTYIHTIYDSLDHNFLWFVIRMDHIRHCCALSLQS